MQESDIRWNEQARAKILEDSDRVLREAVLDLAATRSDSSSDDLVAEINARMKDRFIDFEPGPDLRKYADAIVAGEFSDAAEAPKTAPSHSQSGGSADGGSADGAPAGDASTDGSGTSAPLDSQNGNGVAADPGSGAMAPEGDSSETAVNDG